MNNSVVACSREGDKQNLRGDNLSAIKESEDHGNSETLQDDSIDDARESIPPILEIHPMNISEPNRNKLTFATLAIIVFYNVSGGPFGIEATIKSSGNFIGILGFALFPLIWSIPEALVTAELGSAFAQDASGGVAWVEEAFGERMGLVAGYFSWISGAVDNAIYPTLFLEYLFNIFNEGPQQINVLLRFFLVSILSTILAGVNYTGLKIVGTASLWICIISMAPFVIFCIMGLPHIEPSKWLQLPEVNGAAAQPEADENITIILSAVLWRPYLNNLFWNLNSFDSAAHFAGEVDDLKKTYPKSLFWGVIMCYFFYLVPLIVATGVTDTKQEDWVDGHLATVATEIGGSWLGGWVVFAAGVSNLALFLAEMSADSYLIMGMADRGIIPRIFKTRSRYGTPTYGILLGLVVIIFMSVANFSQLVEILNFNYAISLVMEYAAFVKLRYTRKDLPRPYRIPIPDCTAILLVLPPCIGIFIIFIISSWITKVFVFCAAAAGLLLYILCRLAKERHWCEFHHSDHIAPKLDEGSNMSLGHFSESKPDLMYRDEVFT